MRMRNNRNDQRTGGALVWVLLALVAVAVVAFLLMRAGNQGGDPVAVATPPPATPAPATPEPATPAPRIVAATPPPAPVATPKPATPAPATPPPLDLATLARTPALWPKQVALVKPVSFPILVNGRVAGAAEARAGTVLPLLRVAGLQVEVLHQSGKQMIFASATNLLQRAQAATRPGLTAAPAPPPGAAIPVAVARPTPIAPLATAATPAAASLPAMPKAKIGDRLTVEVVRMKKARIEGGDFDDKKERITMKVKIANTDTSLSAGTLKGEIWVFGESILDRGATKLLATQSFEFPLPPRGMHEMTTDEAVTAFDTTGARFGYRYEGWLLRLTDKAGEVVLQKSNSPAILKNADKISTLRSGSVYDRVTFKEKNMMR